LVYNTGLQNNSEKIKNTIKDLDLNMTYFSLNKLRNIIRKHKKIFQISNNKNVVYKILCEECDASYIEQIRQLRIRITEHKNYINRNTTFLSVITNYRIDYNHEFNWNDVEILDNEYFLSKRLLSEILHICTQINSLNLQR